MKLTFARFFYFNSLKIHSTILVYYFLSLSVIIKAQVNEDHQMALMKSNKIKRWEIYNDSNQLEITYNFDKKGKMIKEERYNKHSNLSEEYSENLKFDEHDNELEAVKVSHNMMTNHLERTTLKYSYTYTDSIIIKREYSQIDTFGRVQYTSIELNLLDELSRINTKLDIFCQNDSKDTTFKSYEYDAKGLLIREFQRDNTTTEGFDFITTYQYDSLNNLIQSKSAHTSKNSYSRREYKYNDKNQCIHVTLYNFDATILTHSEQEREKYKNEYIEEEQSIFYDDKGLVSQMISIRDESTNKFSFKYIFYD